MHRSSLGAVPFDSNRMSDAEIQALFSCKDEFIKGVDPLLLASKLLQCERLSRNAYSQITHMFESSRDRSDITEYLISHLPSNTNIYDLVGILDECDYRRLASRLFLAFLRLNMEAPSHVHKTSSGQRSTVHTFFRRLKRMVHDAQFENPRLALRNLAQRFVDQLSVEENPAKKQQLADKCVAIIGAEIDAIAITFDNKLYEHDVFAEMQKLIPETSNTLITDVVYYGRLANANSIAGKFDDSENMLTAARSRAYHTGPCLELVNMLYIEVYVRLWQYEKTPSQDLRSSLMMWGRIGLESLEQEAAETKALWRRMFILRMVFCLLGLGNHANTIEGFQVDEACIAEASALLADIDRHWYGIETRREMFYCVARARLCEWKNRIPESLVYLRKAKRLAMEGRFEEIRYISEYFESLSSGQLASTPDTEQPQNSSNGNYIVNERLSNSTVSIETPYMRTSDAQESKNISFENHIEIANDDQTADLLETPFLEKFHHLKLDENQFFVADNPEFANLCSNNGPMGLSDRPSPKKSCGVIDPNLTSPKAFEADEVMALEEQKDINDTNSFTDRKSVHEETKFPPQNSFSQDLLTEDTHPKQVKTQVTHVKQVQERMNEIATPTSAVNKAVNKGLLCYTNNSKNTESKVRPVNKKEVCSSESLRAMSYKNIDGTQDLNNDPLLQLDSVVFFEERGEPSGCSREGEPCLVKYKLSTDKAEQRDENKPLDDDSSVDSLDLFGD